MARYTNPTGKKGKYKQTDPVYGSFDKADVDAGLASGEFVLMERTVHAKVDGQLVASQDRRFFPKGDVDAKKKKGWAVVSLSGAEVAASIPQSKKSMRAGE